MSICVNGWIGTRPLIDSSNIVRGRSEVTIAVLFSVLLAAPLSWPWGRFGAAHKGRKTKWEELHHCSKCLPALILRTPAFGFSWWGITVLTMTKYFEDFQEPAGHFFPIIWCEEICVHFRVWREPAHHWAQEQWSPIPTVCIQVQGCLLLKIKNPSFLTWGLKRRLCRKTSVLPQPILSCFLLEWEVQATAVQLLEERIVAQLGVGGGWEGSLILGNQEANTSPGVPQKAGSSVCIMGRTC